MLQGAIYTCGYSLVFVRLLFFIITHLLINHKLLKSFNDRESQRIVTFTLLTKPFSAEILPKTALNAKQSTVFKAK